MTALRDTILQDLRYAVRGLRQSLGFTLVAVLTLAIGIGATTAVFTVINGILFRPLPYPDQDRLVAVSLASAQHPESSMGVSDTDVGHWRAETHVFEQLEFVSRPDVVAMSSAGFGERVAAQHISAQLLPLLGIKSFVGNLPTDETSEKQGALGVLISYDFWKHHFGGDPNVLGRTIYVDAMSGPIYAVLQPGFDLFGTGSPEVYIVDGMPDATAAVDADYRWLVAVGKLKPDVSPQQAQAAMNVTTLHLAEAFPEAYKNLGVRVEPLQRVLFGTWTRRMYYTLFGAVGLVLMIACANVANLLLVRGEGRRKEISVRVALGAKRKTLIRQLLTESLLLSLMGGVAGFALSLLNVRILSLWTPSEFPRIPSAVADARVLLFTFCTCLLTSVAFGLFPAYRATKTDLNNDLKEGGRGTRAISHHRARNTLVISQVALVLVLLVCAGLMINTLIHIFRTSPGFNPEQLLTAEIRLTGEKYMDTSQVEKTNFILIRPSVEQFCQSTLERLRTLPGVDGVAMIDWLPLIPNAQYDSPRFTTAGQSVSTAAERPRVWQQSVSSDYFHLMEIPVLRGRGISEQDTQSNAWVVVINESMARRFWPNEDPLGKVIKFEEFPEERPREIVGIVRNVRQRSLTIDPRPEAYVSFHQTPTRVTFGWTESRMHASFIVRTHSISRGLIEDVRRTISGLAPESPVFGLTMVTQTISNAAAPWRFLCEALELFSAIALILAVIGIFGVVSYSVRERRHELAVRIALGAHHGQVLELVVRQAMVLSLVGVAIGLVASFAATPLMARFLYGVKAHDVPTLLGVSLLLITITFFASYIPARYVTKIDPIRILRHE
ncbi:MAG TPA: ABC transporter permease [Terriglobales bacterium]|nr:ABC transporter permease [Terriglobales bacterium]